MDVGFYLQALKTGNPVKRVSTFVSGLFIMALGVALSVKADLGVSPISCVPYVYSLSFPFTLGELTILLNALFIIMQMVVLRRNYCFIQLIQLPAVIVFGYFIDVTLHMVADLNASYYILQVFWCLLSCIVLAFGVFLVIKADLTYLPVDGLAVAIADTFQKEFGKVKVGIDSSMAIIGILSSFVLSHHLQGIREGTIIAALSVGYCVRFYCSRISMVDTWLGKNFQAKESIETLPDVRQSLAVRR